MTRMTAAARTTAAFATVVLAACAPDAWQSYKATGFNDYLNVVQNKCQPLWIGDMNLPTFDASSAAGQGRQFRHAAGCDFTPLLQPDHAGRFPNFHPGTGAEHYRCPDQSFDRLHDRAAAAGSAASAAGGHCSLATSSPGRNRAGLELCPTCRHARRDGWTSFARIRRNKRREGERQCRWPIATVSSGTTASWCLGAMPRRTC